MARVAAARTAGYAVIDQELEVGLTSIAVPVIDREGKVVAAINVGTQATRFPPGIIVAEILPKLLKVQAELARIV